MTLRRYSLLCKFRPKGCQKALRWLAGCPGFVRLSVAGSGLWPVLGWYRG